MNRLRAHAENCQAAVDEALLQVRRLNPKAEHAVILTKGIETSLMANQVLAKSLAEMADICENMARSLQNAETRKSEDDRRLDQAAEMGRTGNNAPEGGP